MAAAATSGGCAPLSGPPDLSLALREALLKVLENRPEDPVSFLAEYFESAAAAAAAAAAASEGAAEKPGPRLQQEQVAGALKQLLLCHYSRPAFSRNVASAFQILSCQAGKRKKPGLKGRAYTELLRQICGAADLSSCSLVHKLQCWDHEAVPFSVFRHGVLTCFVYLEFVMVSRRLFEAVAESGEADRPVCQALLEALKDAVSVGGSSGASGYLDAGSKLGPDQLARAMEQAVRLRKNQSTAAMTQEEFILLTAPLFIQKVKSIC